MCNDKLYALNIYDNHINRSHISMFLPSIYFRYMVLAMKSMLKIVYQYDLQGDLIRKWDHVLENRESGAII